jgi:hypothetical protein
LSGALDPLFVFGPPRGRFWEDFVAVNLASFLPGKLLFPDAAAANQTARPRVSPKAIKRRPRFLYILGFFIFWAGIICLRLVWLQVVMHQRLCRQSRAPAAADL